MTVLASHRTRFLLSCACAAMVPALACPGEAAARAAADAAAQNAAAPSAAADANTGTDDIIVTAQRRDQSVQDVPFTVQALSGDQLSQYNVSTFSDLLKYTPNVTLGSNGPGQGAIFMRGLSTGFVGNQSTGTIAPFPNVALYLDDQSMQFPARNVDVYFADMARVEVLEGPQGTLFGGGAEAGAVRYITNKPKINEWSGHVEGSFGGTDQGAPNGSVQAAVNIPVITDKVAIRAVIYEDHDGGYIDNVRSTFTRQASDAGSISYGFIPSTTNQPNNGQYNNYALAKSDYNPVDYTGGRVAAKWQITPDWDALVSESYQHIDAEGTFTSFPIGSDFQQLGTLQTTTFNPSYNKDTFWNTAWSVNGKIGGWQLVYTGAYMTRHVENQQDYTNYSRTAGGMYYQCTGSATGFGSGPLYCYGPQGYWHDNIRNTHHTEELRVSSPLDKRIRVIAGAYYEKFKIEDVMRFDYTTIPPCTSASITAGAACVGQVQTFPGATANEPGLEPVGTTFGEDTQRGYRQFAFYGSVDFDILPNLTLTGGTRYYNYNEYELGSQFQTYTDCYQVLVCPVAGGGNHNIDADNDHVVYRGFKSKGELSWKPYEHTLVYALFSQGFRPGGFNRRGYYILPNAAGVNQYFRPLEYNEDRLTNYEVGLKTDLLDHKVQLNLSGYYMIWNNPPINIYDPPAGYGNTSFQTNGPSYHIKGFEAQVVARPLDGLTMQAGFTYNDARQSSAPLLTVDNPAAANFGSQLTQTCKTPATCIPLSSPFGNIGDPTPFAPKVQGNLRGRYEWRGTAAMKWFMTGGVTYTGPEFNEPSTYPSGYVVDGINTIPGPNGTIVPKTTIVRYRQPGYALLDASFGFKRDRYTVSIFGDNLTDSHASTFTSSGQFIKAETPVRPLTYGVKVGVDF